MTALAAITPFFVQYPIGAGIVASNAATPSNATVTDIVDIRSRLTGTFTAAAADTFSVGKLFTGAAPSGSSIAGYQVALRGDGSTGRLTLDGNDVTTTSSFTADEFGRLQYVAGANGSSDDLVVVAQTGQRLADGTLVNEVDSPAVQLTANVTGTRSLNAIAALNTPDSGTDGDFVSVARQASILSGFGAARPGLTTVGTFTSTAADTLSIGKLFNGTAPSGSTIAGYQVALRSDGNSGQLTLDGNDVSTRRSFTADEFARLQYVAGTSGSSDDLVVVAQTGQRLADGTLVNEIDSPAVQITANVTGTRSLNAIAALNTPDTGSDGDFVTVARQASIFTGFGAARPGLSTVGNLTATAADNFSVGKLFNGTAPAGGSIAGYQVALRSDGSSGQLTLDGNDVTTKRSFTADEFARLQYVAGTNGSSDDLVVVAQSGQRLNDGTLANEIDSPAVQITATVTGTRSINAVVALNAPATDTDGPFISIARQASILSGFGVARPSLSTVGNLTATASDNLSIGKLFSAVAPAGGTIAGYQVALRNAGSSGTLTLDGNDVTTTHSFTADEFARLQYTAGAAGSSDDLVVVAQSGQRLADGTIVNEIDSPAVQITAGITGSRSLNAIAALNTEATGSDHGYVGIVRQASILAGFGAIRPGLSTVGNFTATAADTFSVGNLFTGSAPSGGSIAGYQVALRSGGDSGRLTLDGNDVTSQLSYTADEFARLQYVAGANGSSDDLAVVTQSGQRLADGTLVDEIDSPAVQITAAVTGSRSINAAIALNATTNGTDAAFIDIARKAGILNGLGAARPTLGTVGGYFATPDSAALFGSLLDTFQSSDTASAGALDIETGFVGATGQSQSSSASADPAATAITYALQSFEIGGFQSAGSTAPLQRFAAAAYKASSLAV